MIDKRLNYHLTESEIDFLRTNFTGEFGQQKEFAEEFGVTETTIGAALIRYNIKKPIKNYIYDIWKEYQIAIETIEKNKLENTRILWETNIEIKQNKWKGKNYVTETEKTEIEYAE